MVKCVARLNVIMDNLGIQKAILFWYRKNGFKLNYMQAKENCSRYYDYTGPWAGRKPKSKESVRVLSRVMKLFRCSDIKISCFRFSSVMILSRQSLSVKMTRHLIGHARVKQRTTAGKLIADMFVQFCRDVTEIRESQVA